jgi:hypothetical protein
MNNVRQATKDSYSIYRQVLYDISPNIGLKRNPSIYG